MASITNQPALACAERRGRTLIGYERKVTWKVKRIPGAHISEVLYSGEYSGGVEGPIARGYWQIIKQAMAVILLYLT